MSYDLEGQEIATDEEGYITNLGEWTPELGSIIA
jgi:sulfur relay (sulfurtransferase) DsrC/TusE family protein